MRFKISSVMYLIIGIVTFALGVFTMTGDVQKFIKFSDPLGEIAFCVFAFLASMFSIAGSFSIEHYWLDDLNDDGEY